MEVAYDDEPASFEVRSGNVIITRHCGTKLVRPLAVFRIELERSLAAITAYDQRNAQVIPIRKRGAH